MLVLPCLFVSVDIVLSLFVSVCLFLPVSRHILLRVIVSFSPFCTLLTFIVPPISIHPFNSRFFPFYTNLSLKLRHCSFLYPQNLSNSPLPLAIPIYPSHSTIVPSTFIPPFAYLFIQFGKHLLILWDRLSHAPHQFFLRGLHPSLHHAHLPRLVRYSLALTFFNK